MLNALRRNDYPDYNYRQPYYDEDQLSGRQGTAFNRGIPDPNNYDYDGLYQTSPKYKYGGNEYRQRYPTDSRKGRVRQRNVINKQKELSNINNNVKPIAMRDTRTGKSLFGANVGNSLDKDIFNKVHKRSGHSFGNLKRENKHSLFRQRRHIAPHDENGLQRLLSTGSLAPTLLPSDHPNFNHSIDVVFATYWFFPAKTRAILPEDQHCIEKKMSEETVRFDPKSKFHNVQPNLC